MKKIIVTGGSGFIGSNLVKFLLKKNYFVINIDKLTYSANSYNLSDIRKNKNYKFFKLDINDSEKLFKILNKFNPSAIFNLAAETHVDRSIENPKNFIKSNITGVYSLLEVIKKYLKNKTKKTKLIHVSTDEVYGDIDFKKRCDENFSYNPSSPYSASKASADMLVASWGRTFNIPYLITNCSNNFGPRQYIEKLIPKIIFNGLNNIDIPVYGNGLNVRDWIFVDDHTKIIIDLHQQDVSQDRFNIGGDKFGITMALAKCLVVSGTTAFKISLSLK